MNKILDILYSKDYKYHLEVFKDIFEISEEVPENPDYLVLIQSMAKSNGLVFDFDGLFFGKMVRRWVYDYSPDEVFQAIKSVVPNKYYQDVLFRIEHISKLPSDIINFLVLSLLENSENDVIELNYTHFNEMSNRQSLALKRIIDSSDKEIRISVSTHDLSMYHLGTETTENHPVFSVFSNEVVGSFTPSTKKDLKRIILSHLENYDNYFKKHKQKKPYSEYRMALLYPNYFVYKDCFLEKLDFLQGQSNTGDLILEHLELYESKLSFKID